MKLKIPQYQLSEVLNMMAFKGISEADIKTMMDLRILREHYYRYNSTIFKAGEITEELGIVIKGRVIVENVDYWGSKSILSSALPGKVFGETYPINTIFVFLCFKHIYIFNIQPFSNHCYYSGLRINRLQYVFSR